MTRDERADAVPQIVAAVPAAERCTSRTAHLYLPAYTPTNGGKSLSRDRTHMGSDFVWQHSMCGTVAVNEVHPGAGGRSPHPWKYEHRTLSEAQAMVRAGYVRWCHVCIGHAVQVMGLPLEVVRLVMEKQLRDGVAP